MAALPKRRHSVDWHDRFDRAMRGGVAVVWFAFVIAMLVMALRGAP